MQHVNIAQIVPRLINGRFGDESGMGQTRIVKQPSKRLCADASLPNMLVAIEAGAAGGFGIIAMPDGNILQSYGQIKVPQGLVHPFFANYVISGNMGMAGINAGGDGHHPFQPLQQFGKLIETGPQREFGPGGIFDQNRKPTLSEIQTSCGRCNRFRNPFQSLLATAAAKRTRMKDQIVGA